jgi:hypothetical protein
MKKLIFTSLLAVGIAAGSHAQGTVTLDNANNFGAPLSAATGGSIYLNGALLNTDVNVQLMGGASAGSMVTIATLLLSNGTASGDYSFLGNPGQFADPNGLSYAIPGVALNGTAFVELFVWTGSATSYANATTRGFSGVYKSLTGGGSVGGAPPNPPTSIGDAMPSFEVLLPSPEPGTLALFGLGAVTLLLLRRRK